MMEGGKMDVTPFGLLVVDVDGLTPAELAADGTSRDGNDGGPRLI
jgi:hypothetical protein